VTREGILNKQVHVYLDERDHRDLKAWAAAECRSVNRQVVHIVREALASRSVEMSSLTQEQLVEKIKNATRKGLSPP
jgi:hypothetical protein